MGVKVSASVLAANFANLGADIRALNQAQEIDLIHFDLMDGHFVPNLTFGVPFVKALRDYTDKPFDVHLMVSNPQVYFEELAVAGANLVSFHLEAVLHHDSLLSQLHQLGLKTGIALNPSTPIVGLKHVIDKLDSVLVMSVNPGFGGQQFIEESLHKIKELNTWLNSTPYRSKIEIFVDGGVNDVTAGKLKEAGADVLVAGSYLFGGGSGTSSGQLPSSGREVRSALGGVQAQSQVEVDYSNHLNEQAKKLKQMF